MQIQYIYIYTYTIPYIVVGVNTDSEKTGENTVSNLAAGAHSDSQKGKKHEKEYTTKIRQNLTIVKGFSAFYRAIIKNEKT